ncbi:sensor histidine kinase [Siphonobacter aquaeclarae]|uniref:histidine kinase n=1 Tax=Siphonobacter aquaeclarae TaxID=563176 RepID=A0A1G9VAE0_9BACT|nr:HAMP domain-containing sensor histidine kinase [Siphonobacter aquaeclarae]SDM69162.1 Histidine kinase-, DNA gyrase B-, and HSP90-like ATPase [Siphonobacter aquaeclarae]
MKNSIESTRPAGTSRPESRKGSLSARMLSGDLYQQKNQVKVGILVILLLFSGGWFYYTQSLIAKLEAHEEEEVKLYAESMEYALTSPLDTDLNFFMDKVVKANTEIPVIIEYQGQYQGKNLVVPKNTDERAFLKAKAEEFRTLHPPKEFNGGFGKGYVYFSHSFLFTQLQYYPLVMFLGLLVFGYLAYLAFSAARRSEQNRVWVGLAKETAHQLGTPLSGLKGWVEYFKTDPDRYEPEFVLEVEKDVERLETITARFSNIGSVPTLTPEPLARHIEQFVNYLKRRVSSKIRWEIVNELPEGKLVPVNRYLFEWVIENLCKNAVDAMEGVGELHIHLHQKGDQVILDIRDSGKGIPKSNWKSVFNPGFSTKKRGWGLGLTLAKRIIENYHRGKLFVRASEPGKGTTFRISIPEKN